MRILLIGDYKPIIGGPATVVTNLARYLSEKDDVIVVSTEKPTYDRGLRYWIEGNIEIYQERLPLFGSFTFIQSSIQKMKRCWSLRKTVDIYHAHSTYDGLIGLVDRKKPLVITLHGYTIQELLFSGELRVGSILYSIYNFIDKMVIGRADAIIAVGLKQREWLINTYNLNPSKVIYIPNGIDTKLFHSIPKVKTDDIIHKYNLSNKKILLFTKHFIPRYGARYIIDALPKIIDEFPNTVCIMTNDDPYKDEIINHAKKIGVDKYLITTGRVEINELIQLYNVCDVYLHTSINDQETFGISIIEAMACGKPVIATSVGGPNEILNHGKVYSSNMDVGILIPPKDSEAIVKNVVELFRNPDYASEIGKRAEKFVFNNYSWDSIIESTREVYHVALKNYDDNC
jgi:glycosyltransferase involved in cell wall biosynthesis